MLGDGEIEVQLWERVTTSTRRHVISLNGRMVSGSWERRLNNVSTATFEVALPGSAGDLPADANYRDALGSLRTVRFELDVVRDPGGTVWQGPLTMIEWSRDTVRLAASDVLWWLTRRFVRDRLFYENPIEVTELAAQVIRSALEVSDPAVLQFIDPRITGLNAKVDVQPLNFVYGWRALQDLIRNGLDISTVGRSIVLAGGELPLQDFGTLTDAHFLTDLRVTEDANQGATRVVTLAGNLYGDAGGEDPYFGLIETRWRQGTTIVSSTTIDLERDAESRLALRNPMPRSVVVPDGARLSPFAPASIDRLIAGAKGTIAVTNLVVAVNEQQRLDRVNATYSPSGEEVKVRFQPVGTTGSTLDAS